MDYYAVERRGWPPDLYFRDVSPEAEVGDDPAHQHNHQLTQEQQEVTHAAIYIHNNLKIVDYLEELLNSFSFIERVFGLKVYGSRLTFLF